MLRAALDCVVIVDHEGVVTEVNPATEETFGWTRSEAIGKRFLELTIAAEHRAELADVLEDRLRPAARCPARGEGAPRGPAPVPRRARDHPRRRPRPAALRRLAPRRDEAPPARRAHARSGGEVPHARRAAPDRDVRQRHRHARADALHEPADRDDARLPGLRLAPPTTSSSRACIRTIATACSPRSRARTSWARTSGWSTADLGGRHGDLGARPDGRRARRGVPPDLPAGLPRPTSPTAEPPTRRCVRARRRIASCSRRRAT